MLNKLKMHLAITSTEYLIPVITGGLLSIALTSFIIYFILLYRRSQSKLHFERERIKKELLRVENEVQEQTLLNVSRELHDNLGQIASLVKINLNMLAARLEGDDLKQAQESLELIKQLIADVKSLSESIKGERIIQLGWIKALEEEVRRINAIGGMQIDLNIEGTPSLSREKEVILFRIIQESLNNALKHSRALEAKLNIVQFDNIIEITIEDYGTGFDLKGVERGSGLNNLQARCDMIGGELDITSNRQAGTRINIKLSTNET